MMLLPQKRFSEFVLVLDNFFLYPFLLLHLALPCSSLFRRKRRSAHPFNTLTSKIDSRISMVSCMNNYVGTINNNCVGSMALVTWLPSFLLKNDLELYPSRLIYCQQQETAQ